MSTLPVLHLHLRVPVLILALSAASLLGLSAQEARAQTGSAESGEAETGKAESETAEIGKQVPAFEIEALRGPERAITPSDFEGRYVLLNLWATWCAPCIEKIPDLQEARRRYPPEKLAILNVSFDRPRSKATALLEKREMPGSHAHAGGGLMGEFGDKFARMPSESASVEARGLPNMTLVGPEGEVLDIASGGSADVLKTLSEHL